MGKNIFYFLPIIKTLCPRWNQQSLTWIGSWGPPSIGVFWKQLCCRWQLWKSSLTKFNKKSSIFLRNFRNFFQAFLIPQCTLGTKISKNSRATKTKTRVLFQKMWWKRMKEYSFTLQIERDIEEDDHSSTSADPLAPVVDEKWKNVKKSLSSQT